MQSEPDYYSILQLPAGAGIDRVRDHHRRLAKVFHPDRNGGDRWCHEQITRINIAFEYLRAPERKAAYDSRLARMSKAASLPHVDRGCSTQAKHSPHIVRRVTLKRMLRYDLEEPRSMRSRLASMASWAVVVVSIGVFALATVRQSEAGAGMRQMMFLPPLHTGLMAAFTGGGPKAIEHEYRDQLNVLADSAESGLDDARDTLTELTAQDRYSDTQTPSDHHRTDNTRRSLLELQLRAQSEDLATRLRLVSREINRFDWTTPGVRRRLNASTIDADLRGIDDAIDPLHDNVCAAQALIIDRDTFGPTPQSPAQSKPESGT
jgi:curved DNA-binding protein CbpA